MGVLDSLASFAKGSANAVKKAITYPLSYMKEAGIKDGLVNAIKRYGYAGLVTGAVAGGLMALGVAYPAVALAAMTTATIAGNAGYWATLGADLYNKFKNAYQRRLSPGKGLVNTGISAVVGSASYLLPFIASYGLATALLL